MASRDVEIVKAAWDAYAANDVERTFRYLSPDIVWYPAPGHPGPRVYRGHDEIYGWLADIAASFSTYRMQVTGFRDLGDCVLAHGTLYAERDGVAVIDRVTTWRCFVRDDAIVRVDADVVPADEHGAPG